MFRDRAHDGGDGCFLKRICADCIGRDLAANDDDGHGIRHAVPDRCNSIGGAGARGHHHHTHVTARTCVACCHEACALLVSRDNQ